jgi:hypothetical protein
VYHASLSFGPTDLRATPGYFEQAGVFERCGYPENAQVTRQPETYTCSSVKILDGKIVEIWNKQLDAALGEPQLSESWQPALV